MSDEAESDIGLYDLSRRSDSLSLQQLPLRTPPKVPILDCSEEITITVSDLSSPLRSPSQPNLSLPASPKVRVQHLRKLSRSNTLPRLISRGISDVGLLGQDQMPVSEFRMDPEKVAKLRRWVLAIVIVDFDLDYGPKIEGVYPHLELSPKEAENIAFSSFPDSPQTSMGSSIHSFRLRYPPSPLAPSTPSPLAAATPNALHENDGFLYGYSHFTQLRDASSKRGYQQRSLVLLSQHPLPSLFYTLLAHLGKAFLSHGTTMIEVACHNIANWSDPRPGETLELGFLGYVFTAELPSSIDTQQMSTSTRIQAQQNYSPDSHIVASLAPHNPPILPAFEACLTHIWSIWECLVLNEPILVYGPSATMTSQVVWWLRDLLRPIPIAGDFRPFFTIHDAEHSVLVSPRPPVAGLLLGVTNPIFDRTCNHWPHVLSLGAPRKKTGMTPIVAEMTVGPEPGWRTKTHKRYISRDQALLKKLEDACRGDGKAKMQASEALREHLSSRTTALLVPLQRYLNTLLPTPAEAQLHTPVPTPTTSTSSISSFANSPVPPRDTHLHVYPSPSTLTAFHPPRSPSQSTRRLKPFSESAFFASLKANGAPLPFKSSSKRKEFYERWVRTKAFGVWIAGQEEMMNRVLQG